MNMKELNVMNVMLFFSITDMNHLFCFSLFSF